MSADNIKLGTCSITYGSTDLGLTIGGVEVEVTTTTHETKVDQFGDTVVQEKITGRNVTVRVPMAETTLDKLVEIMPGASKITGGGKSKVEVKTGVGVSLRDSAKELRLRPTGKSDASEDFVIPLAATPGGINFAYKIDQERVFVADFKGYPDDNGLLFIYGDKSATAAGGGGGGS